jgi:hypothetical protein
MEVPEMRTNETQKLAENTGKRAWTRPTLKYVGDVGDVLQGGGGKLTPSPADPGESRKPKGGAG